MVNDKNPKFRKTFHDKNEAMRFAGKIGNQFNVKKNPDRKEPTAYSLLSSLTKSDPGSFDDFCHEFGYNNDSISARDTWQAVREEWQDVRGFFSKPELEELQEIN